MNKDYGTTESFKYFIMYCKTKHFYNLNISKELLDFSPVKTYGSCYKIVWRSSIYHKSVIGFFDIERYPNVDKVLVPYLISYLIQGEPVKTSYIDDYYTINN